MSKDEKSKSSGRNLRIKVKPGKERTASSRAWLERQLNDPYVAAAKREGYRSRAAYKLVELDQKYRFLKRGARICDLGAAPGGWTQVAVDRVGVLKGAPGRVVGLDISPMEPVAGAEILHADFLDPDAPAALKQALGGPADAVISDMAAPATGHRPTDHLKIMALCEAALDFAEEVLAPGGVFLCKVQRGGAEAGLVTRMRKGFREVHHFKPPASRSDSAEMYVVALGFRGQSA